jgi:Protein of unknown function (DUF2892)
MNIIAMITNNFARNVGALDRIARGLFALSIPALYLLGWVSGIAAIVLGVLAVLVLRTSVTGKCGIYYGLGLSTYREESHAQALEPDR